MNQPNPRSTGNEINRLTSTQVHVHLLLSTLATLENFLVDQGVEVGGRSTLEGISKGVADEAEFTFTMACKRLSTIINDAKRWEVTELDEVAKALKEKIAAETATQKRYLEAIESQDRPFFKMKAHLAVLANGKWIAALTTTPGNMPLLATGSTPSEAAANFDAIFEGAKPAEVVPPPVSPDRPPSNLGAPRKPRKRK